jgi:hypothetical protein
MRPGAAPKAICRCWRDREAIGALEDRLRGVIGLAAPVYWNMEKFAG